MTDTKKDIAWACKLSWESMIDIVLIKKELKKQQEEIIKIKRFLITIPIALLIGFLLGFLL